MSCSPPAATRDDLEHAPARSGELTLSTSFPAVVAVELPPESQIRCERLHAALPARACVVRQLANLRARTHDTWRGQAGIFPGCDETCARGREVRAALAGAGLSWRGAWVGGRFPRTRDGLRAQMAARRRLRLVGLLDPIPCLDEPPGDEDSAAEAPGCSF